MKLFEELLRKGNVISSMVIRNSRERIFKMEGIKYQVEEKKEGVATRHVISIKTI